MIRQQMIMCEESGQNIKHNDEEIESRRKEVKVL
jgi:hypothetical protein